MPEFKAPGVYVQEINSNIRPIAKVSTSTAALVGFAASGPNTPVLVKSFVEYEATFGGFTQPGFLPYAVMGFFENGGTQCYVVRTDATDDPSTTLHSLDDLDVSIVGSPDGNSIAGMAAALIAHCEALLYRFAILDAPQTPVPIQGPPADAVSSFAAYYYPWLTVANPTNGQPVAVPPSGYVAGIYAQNDANRGVWHAPAGLPIEGILGLDQVVTEQQQAVLNPLGVDVLRNFPAQGDLVWGARTTSQDPQWRYISVRRLMIFIEQSISQGTRWVIFEPNGPATWAQVRNSVANFLKGLWQQGALQGTTPEQAYFVRCDQTTMTQNDLDNGRLVIVIGLAIVQPAEFVVLQIGQETTCQGAG